MKSRTVTRRPCLVAILLFLLVGISISAIEHKSGFHMMNPIEGQQSIDNHTIADSYITTRKQAIIDYIQALQDTNGYFHAYLEAPPPFEPDRTPAGYSSLVDAYDSLSYIDALSSINWNSSKEFLQTLVDEETGLMNASSLSQSNVATCFAVVSIFPELGIENVIDQENIVDFVARLQQSNGGFIFGYNAPDGANLVATYFALSTLSKASRLNSISVTHAREFVRECYNADGGFTNIIGEGSSFHYVVLGLIAFDILNDWSSVDEDLTANFLHQFWDNSVSADLEQDLLYTERIVWALTILNRLDSIDINKTTEWVLNLQLHNHGEFVGYPGAEASDEKLIFTKYATHILNLCAQTQLLDDAFLVEEEPEWRIPQWWLDYVSEHFPDTTPNQPIIPVFRFDFSVVLSALPYVVIISCIAFPAIYYIHEERKVRIDRRLRKKKKLGSSHEKKRIQ